MGPPQVLGVLKAAEPPRLLVTPECWLFLLCPEVVLRSEFKFKLLLGS